MDRRGFIKKRAIAAGLAGSLEKRRGLAAEGSGPQARAAQENRSADYLRRVRQDQLLPKPPMLAESLRSPEARISPMPLAERVRRRIVPRRGFCSIAPDSDALLSFRKQDVTLIARYGSEAITAPAGVLAAPLQAGKSTIDVRLPENKPVTSHLKLGRRKPLDWVERVARANPDRRLN
jgi:hypothetical protein